MVKIVYCTEWSLFKKQPHNILNEQDAKSKFVSEGIYVAVIYENEKVKNVIEIDEMSLTVRFYNDNQENYLLYGFVKKNDKLFLNTAYHYTYFNNKKIEHILFNFKENGEMFVEKKDYISGELEEREAVVDVSCNWEPFPKFGEYAGVIKVDREK